MLWSVVAVLLAIYTFFKLRGVLMINRFLVDKSKCLVTGGSQGLGKSIALELIKKGADVVICARRQTELEKTVEELSKHKIYKDQQVDYKVCDVTDKTQVAKLFSDPVQYLFCCVGQSKPMLFEDQAVEQFERSIQLNYLSAVYCAYYASKHMREVKSGKIVFIGSTLSCFGMVGFSEYVPAKFALRGLAESLRNEFLKDNIDVHIYLPGSIDTPGFAEEQKTKPEVARFIEGQTKPASPESLAKKLIKGLELNYFAITTDFVTEMVYVGGRGVAPVRNAVTDLFALLIAVPFCMAMRFFIDLSVLRFYPTNKK